MKLSMMVALAKAKEIKNVITTRIVDMINPAFLKLNAQVDSHLFSHFWLKGGRGSGKSSYVALKIVRGMAIDPEANAVVMRKVGETLHDTVFETYRQAIKRCGMEDCWQEKLSPLRLVYKGGGEIRFKGADKPSKIKSQAFSHGVLKFVHYEEADDFTNEDELDSINISLMRGEGNDEAVAFYTYNPPKHRGHWLNTHILTMKKRTDTIVHHSDYTTMPEAWLGKTFVRNAQMMKELQPNRYKHIYMGENVATGMEVFDNLELRPITQEEKDGMAHFNYGCDFGFGADPFVLLETSYNRKRGILYINNEFWGYGANNATCVEAIQKINPENDIVNADSAEPRTINEFNELGAKLWGVMKGKGSVNQGVKWLQGLFKIVIDTDNCPLTAKEFNEYHLEERNGVVRSGYPDKDNHSIDTARYCNEDNITAGQWLY